jgi:hypothetical protein
MRLVLPLALSFIGCAHVGVSNESRLEPSDVGEEELRCRDATPEIMSARDESNRRSERLSRFDRAISEARGMEKRFEEAFRRNPDLIYGAEAAEWKRRQHGCVELARRLERERIDVERLPEDAPRPAVAKAEPAKEEPSKVEPVKPEPEPVKEEPVAKSEPRKASKVAKAQKSEQAAAADAAFEDSDEPIYKPYKKKKHKKTAHKGKKKKGVRLATR